MRADFFYYKTFIKQERFNNNMEKLTKEQKTRIEKLLNSEFLVIKYHKTLLSGIKNNSLKNNLSRADIDIFKTISLNYPEEF
jgi:hypothetical protein